MKILIPLVGPLLLIIATPLFIIIGLSKIAPLLLLALGVVLILRAHYSVFKKILAIILAPILTLIGFAFCIFLNVGKKRFHWILIFYQQQLLKK